MGQRLAALLMIGIAATTVPAWAGDHAMTSRVGNSALGFFENHSDTTIDEFLTALRPAPVDAGTRTKILAALPRESERRVRRAEPAELAKIAAAEPILQYHARANVIAFKVIKGDQAVVGSNFRLVVLVSQRALAMLNAEEFAALVAHEIGHEFSWDEYWSAMRQADHDRMQELELRCDGIAVLTLRRVVIDPERLVSAVQKLTQDNRKQGAATSAADYPPLEERMAFIRAMARMPWPIGPHSLPGETPPYVAPIHLEEE